jgi:hypothetical protein
MVTSTQKNAILIARTIARRVEDFIVLSAQMISRNDSEASRGRDTRDIVEGGSMCQTPTQSPGLGLGVGRRL